VAAYVRLSLEDRSKKGNSIETQQHIISSYIHEHPDLELYDTYIDSGVSGTTFERPNFQRMLQDAKSQKIHCVIVKDLSRLGRDVIDTGYYAEEVFPRLGLRLISIGDNYDSSVDNGVITLPFINLVNEAYVIDISRKTKSQTRQAMQDGIYVGGRPPYGYMRAPNNHRKLIVDTPAADTVRQIFAYAMDGASTSEIARKLNALKIPLPSAQKSRIATNSFRAWHATAVRKILDNEIYLGHLVQGKTTGRLKRQRTLANEWIRVYDTHEAIVSSDVFQAVQALKQNRSKRSPAISYSTNIYKGKIYCAHCGNRLERTKQRDVYIFRCTTNRITPDFCVGICVSEDVIASALAEQLLRLRDDLSRQLEAPQKKEDPLPELRFIDMELHHLQNLFLTLYENLITGVIDQADYLELKRGYQVKEEEYRQRATSLHRLLDKEKETNKHRQESLQILNAFADTAVLTSKHIDRFVCRLIVFRNGKIHVDLMI